MNIFLKNTLIFIFLLTISCNPQNSLENDVEYSNIENDNFELNEIDKVNSNTSKLSFLALGDSYTIGEGVNENERWPNQFVEIANENGLELKSLKS